MALSTALQDVIYVMQLLEELVSFGVKLALVLPEIKCRVLKDNVGTLKLAKAPKLQPRTKHIGIHYHHFCEYVAEKKININYVLICEQVANISTKPLPNTANHSGRFM